MMTNLLNAIVAATLILTFAFASELGPGTRSDARRTVMSPPIDGGPATAAAFEPAKGMPAD